MKLALKYGIFVTLIIAAWVALKHFFLHLEPAPAQIADLVVFNLTAITGLTFGISEKRRMNGGTLKFGDGWVTGIMIAVTYAILISIYFAVLLAAVGPKLMQPGRRDKYGEGVPGSLDWVCFVRSLFLGNHRAGFKEELKVVRAARSGRTRASALPSRKG